MNYLLNDLIKLPLNDRLNIIETAICSLTMEDYNHSDNQEIMAANKETIITKIKFWKSNSKFSISENA